MTRREHLGEATTASSGAFLNEAIRPDNFAVARQAAAFGLRFALPDYLIDMYKSLKSKRSGAPTLRSGATV
jgi:hypothetical protein